MKLNFNFFYTLSFWLQLCASITTLLGIYLGSTTLYGASCYALSLIFWYTLTFKDKMWGIMPLNIATTVVVIVNIHKALQ